MLKFIKHHMETITGIEIYPLISLVLFTVFFTLMMFWVFSMDKTKIKMLEELPLNDNK